MLAFELGEESWLLGFSVGFGEKVPRRKIASRDIVALLREIEGAKSHFGLPEQTPVESCYEAGRDGFWLHRCLEGQDVDTDRRSCGARSWHSNRSDPR